MSRFRITVAGSFVVSAVQLDSEPVSDERPLQASPLAAMLAPVGVSALLASGRVQPASVSVSDLPPAVACLRSTADVLDELRSDW
jgi:hypothetical protein